MSRMHRPEDEKRMVVILNDDEFGPWLTCGLAEAPRYFRQVPGLVLGFAAPVPGRTAASKETPPPPATPEPGELF